MYVTTVTTDDYMHVLKVFVCQIELACVCLMIFVNLEIYVTFPPVANKHRETAPYISFVFV